MSVVQGIRTHDWRPGTTADSLPATGRSPVETWSPRSTPDGTDVPVDGDGAGAAACTGAGAAGSVDPPPSAT
ncbi:hypothetical protein GCM10009868_03380 [Terrabacter aerolatus]|uniref:Uncharacterized protein n=1 Tax=Terrabacter aerolatus TaxID=422442 RepID=A0A512CZJ7_9MICO|nr:hypothetical protein TAE01_14490 [Terrabacter aerolatus]